MLVKELLQGMRARSFTMFFLIFQVLLGFILLSASASSSMDSAGSFASGVIFTMFGIAALLIQPMRGVTALSSEITGNTIEMMVLTRLSASRIVLGKWIAIISQTALILITIIPYLILRYFFGGMVLLGELVFLSLIFLTSMALTAVMVGMSGTNAKFARVMPVIGFIFMLQIIPTMLFSGGFNNFIFAADPEPILRHLGQRHGCVVIFSPFLETEARPAWSGNYEFIDPERHSYHPHRIEPATLRRYQAAYDDHFALWKQQTRRHQTAFARIPAEEDFVTALFREAVHARALEPCR